MKISLKTQATALRENGYFYSEIAQELGIAKSTARLWTKDARLSARTTRNLVSRYSQSRQIHIEKLAANRRAHTLERHKLIQKEAQKIVSQAALSNNHKRIVCACLFWCEGTKNTNAGITFINSDPDMIQTFLKLLRESFSLDERKFRALVHLHEYHHVTEQLQYWSQITHIPLTQFNKPYLKPHTGINKREGYQGCVSLRYLDSSLGKLLKMIYIEFSKSL